MKKLGTLLSLLDKRYEGLKWVQINGIRGKLLKLLKYHNM